MNEVAIYTLNDPRTGEVRYVGKTVQIPRIRLRAHLCSKTETHCNRWIRSLKSIGLLPVFDVIDYTSHAEWEAVEKEYIRVFRMIGIRLTNICEGGGTGRTGIPHSVEACAKISRAAMGNKRNLGRHLSEETRANMRIAAQGRNVGSHPSDETRAKLTLARRGNKNSLGYKHSVESRAKLSAAKLGKRKSDETRARMSVAQLSFHANERAQKDLLVE